MKAFLKNAKDYPMKFTIELHRLFLQYAGMFSLSTAAWTDKMVQRSPRSGRDRPRAHQEARDTLDILRNSNGKGSFITGLKYYLDTFKRDTGINYFLHTETENIRLGPLVELELLSICHEVFSNVKKHSGAKNLRIMIMLKDNKLEMKIYDDGRGFSNQPSTRDEKCSKSYGLSIVGERAKSINGNCRVVSFPNIGTTITIEVPMEKRVNIYGNADKSTNS